jgi:hypothetical protein
VPQEKRVRAVVATVDALALTESKEHILTLSCHAFELVLDGACHVRNLPPFARGVNTNLLDW